MQDCVETMNIVCVFVGMAFLLMDLNSGNLNMICFIDNGNRTEWSTDRIGRHEVLSPIIKTMTKFEKETRHRLYIFIQLTQRNAR